MTSSASAGDDRSVSVVVPTFQEVDNIAQLVERIGAVRTRSRIDLELFLMATTAATAATRWSNRYAFPGSHWSRVPPTAG